MNNHYFEFGDYDVILHLHYLLDGDASINLLYAYESLKNYDIANTILMVKTENETFDIHHIYINGKLVNNVFRFAPMIYFYTKTNKYTYSGDAMRNTLLVFIKKCYKQEINNNAIDWTTKMHTIWPNKQILDDKIKTLLLISKKKHTSKYKYVNCFVKGICMIIIKNICMIEKN